MDPLFAALPPPSADRLRARLGLGADVPAELATTGWCKLVVLLADLAVLVPRNHELVPALRREVEVLRALEEVGLPGAPRLWEVIEDPEISPLPLVVIDRVRGQVLESVEPDLDADSWRRVLEGVGAALAGVRGRGDARRLPERPRASHRTILHGLLDPDAAARREALRSAAAALDVELLHADSLLSDLEAVAGFEPVVVHNDLHEAQIMVGDDYSVTGLLDWQTASVDHPFVDFDLLQWGRGALTRFGGDPAAHRRALWNGAGGDERHGVGSGDLLETVWALNDGCWAMANAPAPVTGLPLGQEVRNELIERARHLLAGGRRTQP